MAEIVAFPTAPADPLIWQCGCGSNSFYLRSDATAECQGCGETAGDAGGWRNTLPSEDVKAPESTVGHIVINLGSPAAALKRIVAKADPGSLVAVVTISKDGQTRTWCDVETAEQRAWLRRQMMVAIEIMGCAND